MTTAQKRLPTHTFLASLGKTVLRPGGKEATNRLLLAAELHKDSKILKVAPNNSDSYRKNLWRYCYGIDINKEAIEKAEENITANNVEHLVTVQRNATRLPFEDNTFDVVLNEAMLTMLKMIFLFLCAN